MQTQVRVKLPNAVEMNGRTIVQSGTGSSQGSHLYIDHFRNNEFELYLAQIIRTGPEYFIAVVPNTALKTVRVDRRALANGASVNHGEIVLIGPIEFLPGGDVRARHAWKIGKNHPAPYASHNNYHRQRLRGRIVSIHPTGTYGRISDFANGSTYFVHINSLKPGVPWRVGTTCFYTLTRTHRGDGTAAANVSLY